MMPIAGYGLIAMLSVLIGCCGFIAFMTMGSTRIKLIAFITILVVISMIICVWFYYNKTPQGRRAWVDERSGLTGLERTINVYTANGEIIATYNGKIDIAESEGGYVKFDYDGKRYIYYNCFVETIAEIE